MGEPQCVIRTNLSACHGVAMTTAVVVESCTYVPVSAVVLPASFLSLLSTISRPHFVSIIIIEGRCEVLRPLAGCRASNCQCNRNWIDPETLRRTLWAGTTTAVVPKPVPDRSKWHLCAVINKKDLLACVQKYMGKPERVHARHDGRSERARVDRKKIWKRKCSFIRTLATTPPNQPLPHQHFDKKKLKLR